MKTENRNTGNYETDCFSCVAAATWLVLTLCCAGCAGIQSRPSVAAEEAMSARAANEVCWPIEAGSRMILSKTTRRGLGAVLPGEVLELDGGEIMLKKRFFLVNDAYLEARDLAETRLHLEIEELNSILKKQGDR